MIVTTGNNFEGFEIVKYIGVVTAEYPVRTKWFKGLYFGTLAKIESAYGWLDTKKQGLFTGSARFVLKALKKSAASLGANGILGVSYQFHAITDEFIMAVAVGTAVVIRSTTGEILDFETEEEQDEQTDDLYFRSITESPESNVNDILELWQDEYQVLRYISKNITDFKDTTAIKDFYLEKVPSNQVSSELIDMFDKRIRLEKQFGRPLWQDTKKDIRRFLKKGE